MTRDRCFIRALSIIWLIIAVCSSVIMIIIKIIMIIIKIIIIIIIIIIINYKFYY